MPSHAGTRPTVVCIGNLTIDEAVPGSVRSEPALGGDAAYAALAARLFVEEVALLAPLGNDLPQRLLSLLREAGIRVDDLPLRDLPTVRNIVTYHDDGSRTWDMLSSDEDFDVLSVYPSDVPVSTLAADGIVLSAMSLESQLALTPWLRKNSQATLYLDLQEDYLEGNREALFSIIAVCDVFMPSEIEATQLAGTGDLAEAARIFQKLGPATVVIKRAEHGCLVLDGDMLSEVPAETTTPVDSTGAGDAFCGAFAATHLITRNAVTAAVNGAMAARIAISSFGIDGIAAAAKAVQHPADVLSPTKNLTL